MRRVKWGGGGGGGRGGGGVGGGGGGGGGWGVHELYVTLGGVPSSVTKRYKGVGVSSFREKTVT